MDIQVTAARLLAEEQVAEWRRLQLADAALDSPFLHPAFTQIVSSVRDDVFVAVLRDGDETVGFFPFQRGPTGAGKPVGCGLSEQQGVIAPGSDWRIRDLLKACRLRSFAFDHLCGDQVERFGTHQLLDESPVLDLRDGYEAYEAQKREQGSSTITQTRRKSRKLEREVGTVHFELHEDTTEALEALLRWKSEQHRLTGVLDTFKIDWVTRFLQGIRNVKQPGFASMLTTLRAGDRLLAVHLGLRTDTTAHVWFPAYDREFAGYSPGMILFLHFFRELSRIGVQRVDFGPGPQRYKHSLQNCSTKIALGAVDRSEVVGWFRSTASLSKQWLKSSPLCRPLETPAHLLFRLRQRLAFRNSGGANACTAQNSTTH